MNIVLIILAIALVVVFVTHLVRTVDPERIGTAVFGADRESLRHPDRDRDRIIGELSAIRAHAGPVTTRP